MTDIKETIFIDFINKLINNLETINDINFIDEKEEEINKLINSLCKIKKKDDIILFK